VIMNLKRERSENLSKERSRVGDSYFHMAWKKFKRNKAALGGLIFVGIIFILGFFAAYIAPYSYDKIYWDRSWEGPSKDFLLGTDNVGRDVLSRILYSLRNALIIAVGAEAISIGVGTFLGSISGYFGGKVDNIIMRICDIMFAFPSFLFNVVLVTVLGRGLIPIFISIGVTTWAGTCRLVRGQVLSVKEREFVEAARALGGSDFDIIFRYILINCLGPIIVSMAFGFPGAMMTEAGLSLIGLGVPPPMPSFGSLIYFGAPYIRSAPHLLIFPVGIFALILISFQFMGDGLRDAFDPRER
jgi:ABC-type dipeptide/oligopeptide/nickel transport system permease subunit